MKTLILIAAWLFSVTCFGQTKLISFKSHSGSNANFRTAVEHNMFDIGNSNFGIVPIVAVKIDTVMLKGNDKIIVLKKMDRKYAGQKNNTFYRTDTLRKSTSRVFV